MSEQNTTPIRGSIEWQSARVAAAFGVKKWRKSFNEQRPDYYRSEENDSLKISWEFFDGHFLGYFFTWCEGEWCRVKFDLSQKEWQIDDYSQGSFELMARGLYLLGFEDESILSQLPPLSMHEQIEARLTMPREFWPNSWLNELTPNR